MFGFFGKKKTPFEKVKSLAARLISFVKSRPELWWYGISLFIFLVNFNYISYPDEFVNILAGKYLLMGKAFYREFFDHHLPFAWFLSAVLLAVSFGSYVIFRLWWALLQWVLLARVGRYIEKNHTDLAPYYRVFMIFYPLITVYYWTHLFLADSLAVLFLSMSFWLLISQTYSKNVRPGVIYAVSIINACFILSSMTYLYLVAFMYLWALYLLVREKWNTRLVVRFIGISAIPYAVLLLYLLVSGSLKDFWVSNFVYNTNYYISIPNYTRGAHFNPIKFALTIIFNFYDNYVPLVTRIKHFDLYFPVSLTAAFAVMFFAVLLGFESITLAVFYFFIVSFSAPRSNVFKIGEMDYQSNVFIMLGIISALLVLYRYNKWQWKDRVFEYLKIAMTALLVLYLFFSFFWLAHNTFNKFYMRYTQKMPSIYNLSYTTDFLHKIIDEDDYYWVGPYEPHEVFFMKKGHLPGKFPTLLPQFRESDYFKTGFIRQFEDHMPAVIIFKHQASIFMTPADEFGTFFLDWMKGKYINVSMSGLKVKQTPSSFELKDDFYMRLEDRDRIVGRLRENGYIE